MIAVPEEPIERRQIRTRMCASGLVHSAEMHATQTVEEPDPADLKQPTAPDLEWDLCSRVFLSR